MTDDQSEIEFEHVPMKLRTRTKCQIDDVDDVWDVDELDEADMIQDAVVNVRDNHDSEITFKVGDLWVFTVYWNEDTESVWVARYGYNGGMEVENGE